MSSITGIAFIIACGRPYNPNVRIEQGIESSISSRACSKAKECGIVNDLAQCNECINDLLNDYPYLILYNDQILNADCNELKNAAYLGKFKDFCFEYDFKLKINFEVKQK